MPAVERERLKAWLALRAVEGVGDAAIRRLVEAFGEPAAIMTAAPDDLVRVGRVRPGVAQALLQGSDQATSDAIDKELRAVEAAGYRIVTLLDAAYPARLKTIEDPPPVLYVAGTLAPEDERAVAVVGSRHATPAGSAVTEELSRDLAAAGLTIVSGLARGIDAAAHRGALAGGGRTIAVLGCGLDRIYPPEHAALRRSVEAHGAVVTEFPIGAQPHAFHFPKRNRLISGLALGVIVTEAARDSGSLITARMALEQNREVFAVPGSVKAEGSRGPHWLLKQGATLVETAADVIDVLLPQLDGAAPRQTGQGHAATTGHAALSQDETRLRDVLSAQPMGIDEVIVGAAMPAGTVAALLLSLELKGAVRQLPGQTYVRV